MSAPVPASQDLSEVGPVVVVTGWRDPDRVRWLLTLSSAYANPTAIERPVVSFQAPPGHPKVGAVLRDLLFALGKSPHVLGGTKHDDGQFDIPASWMLARRTRDIIVNDAAQLPGNAVRALLELAGGVQARLWLIGHHNRAGALDDIVEDWNAEEWGFERFDQFWARPDELPEPHMDAPPTAHTSELPSTCALTFRADCRKHLSAKRFAVIDERYRAEHATATEMFDARETEGELDHNTIAEYLRRRIRTTETANDAVVTVRAIEAAALPRGFYIDVDLPSLINAAGRNPRPGRHTDRDVGALDAYSRPGYAAVCTLAMCDVPPEEMLELTVADIASDGSELTSAGHHVAVPEPMRPYLHAQVMVRRFDGAADTDRLLLTERGKPAHIAWVSRSVKLAEVECSVRLARPRYDRKRLSAYDWLTGHGLTVRAIYGQSRRRQRT